MGTAMSTCTCLPNSLFIAMSRRRHRRPEGGPVAGRLPGVRVQPGAPRAARPPRGGPVPAAQRDARVRVAGHGACLQGVHGHRAPLPSPHLCLLRQAPAAMLRVWHTLHCPVAMASSAVSNTLHGRIRKLPIVTATQRLVHSIRSSFALLHAMCRVLDNP